jgi:hypothetical protein
MKLRQWIDLINKVNDAKSLYKGYKTRLSGKKLITVIQYRVVTIGKSGLRARGIYVRGAVRFP